MCCVTQNNPSLFVTLEIDRYNYSITCCAPICACDCVSVWGEYVKGLRSWDSVACLDIEKCMRKETSRVIDGLTLISCLLTKEGFLQKYLSFLANCWGVAYKYSSKMKQGDYCISLIQYMKILCTQICVTKMYLNYYILVNHELWTNIIFTQSPGWVR